MVVAQTALDIADFVVEVFQLIKIQQRRCIRAMAQGMQRAAVSAHQTGDVRPDNFGVEFLLEGPQHRVVVEGAALGDDMFAQRPRVGGPDDFIQGVFNNADRQTRGDFVDRRPVLLRLLD